MTNPTPNEMQIANLYPFECSVIGSRVVHFANKIKANEDIDPVTVVEVNGCWIVRDGTHRVAAAKECKRIVVPVKIGVPGSELKQFQDALKSAQKRGRLGFENLPRDKGNAEREARTKQELREDYGIML